MQKSLQTKREELARSVPVSMLFELIRAEIRSFGSEAWAAATGVKLANPEEPGQLKEHLGPLFDYAIDLQFLYADRFLEKLDKDNAVGSPGKLAEDNPAGSPGKLLRFTGSQGAIECSPITGNVVFWEESRDNLEDPKSGYKHIMKIDLDEWKEWCRSFGGVWEVGGDILYVGYTCFDGSVEPPEHEARSEYVKMREALLG